MRTVPTATTDTTSSPGINNEARRRRSSKRHAAALANLRIQEDIRVIQAPDDAVDCLRSAVKKRRTTSATNVLSEHTTTVQHQSEPTVLSVLQDVHNNTHRNGAALDGKPPIQKKQQQGRPPRPNAKIQPPTDSWKKKQKFDSKKLSIKASPLQKKRVRMDDWAATKKKGTKPNMEEHPDDSSAFAPSILLGIVDDSDDVSTMDVDNNDDDDDEQEEEEERQALVLQQVQEQERKLRALQRNIHSNKPKMISARFARNFFRKDEDDDEEASPSPIHCVKLDFSNLQVRVFRRPRSLPHFQYVAAANAITSV